MTYKGNLYEKAPQGFITPSVPFVPANSSATLYLPVTGEVNACEGAAVTGSTVHNATQVTQLELVAGNWHFEIVDGNVTVTAE